MNTTNLNNTYVNYLLVTLLVFSICGNLFLIHEFFEIQQNLIEVSRNIQSKIESEQLVIDGIKAHQNQIATIDIPYTKILGGCVIIATVGIALYFFSGDPQSFADVTIKLQDTTRSAIDILLGVNKLSNISQNNSIAHTQVMLNTNHTLTIEYLKNINNNILNILYKLSCSKNTTGHHDFEYSKLSDT